MFQRLFLAVLLLMVGCGKVAQDISSQSNKSIFKVATFSFQFSTQDDHEWAMLVSSKNVTPVFSYFQGLEFDRGFEKIGWVHADVEMSQVASKNVPVVSNFDLKKNIVTSSRYQQGLISLQKVSTNNYRTVTEFRKVRPKFDYYSFAHFMSNNTYAFLLIEQVPTASIEITPHRHLVSAVYLKHLKQESYNKETVIPLSVFYSIIPTAAVTPTLNVMPKNTMKAFHPSRPAFSFNSPLFDALLATVTLAYHGDQYDTLDYVKSKESGVFSDQMKRELNGAVVTYFKSKIKEDVLASPNALEATP